MSSQAFQGHSARMHTATNQTNMAAGYGGLFRGDSMIKRAILALAMMATATIAHAAGTIPGFSLTPQFDKSGKVMPGCKLYIYQAGTVATPQNAYQDSGLTIALPNPMTCDASGRLSQFYLADGLIKLRLTDKNLLEAFAGDNLTVVGASSGGGGGGTVDPTTIAATGDVKVVYGTGPITGWVRLNGRTIGSATSGATERANSDVLALFTYLWTTDANLAVSGGRGANAAADWAANKTVTTPDMRGRVIAGLDDMGNSAAGRLTATYFGATGGCSGALGTTLGVACGGESQTLTLAQIPTGITTSGVNTITVSPSGDPTRYVASSVSGGITGQNLQTAGTAGAPTSGAGWSGTNFMSASNTITAASTNTSGLAHPQVMPTMLVTVYIKL